MTTDAADPSSPHAPVLVIGAGLAGLSAAHHLSRAHRRVLLIDKGRSVGGRLATRRMDGALLDHGAQFFTARSDTFTAAVEEWVAAGVVEEWCRGFGDDDGFPRYRTSGGMNMLPKYLASQLDPDLVDIVTRARVQDVMRLTDGWGATYEGGARESDEVGALITTAPVPQSLELLDAGPVAFDAAVPIDRLRALRYHKVIALLTLVDSPPDLGPHGALQQPDDPTFSFVADNATKGISDRSAVTFHVAHALSDSLFDQSDAAIAEALMPKAAALLGSATITRHQIKKWRYAGPVESWPDRSLTLVSGPTPLVVAGDAFGGPKVEGAFLSGLHAARAVLDAG